MTLKTFKKFGKLTRRQTDRITEADDRYTDVTAVGVSNSSVQSGRHGRITETLGLTIDSKFPVAAVVTTLCKLFTPLSTCYWAM